ncbi:MAG: GtrA family protein [Saccharofermentans sp.]|nr:GtrA family protein [Saccharofermentans sp.]
MGIIKTIIVGGEGLTEKQEKIRKLFMYLVSGCLTTAVNWICYVAFDKLVKADMMVYLFGKEVSLKFIINQIVCWIIAVLVAYFLNRVTVFRSKGSVLRELLTFAGARVLSFLVLEIGFYSLMIWACVSITGLPINTPMAVWQIFAWSFAFTYEYLCKLINSVFIMIANYVMSKVMVFKKKDMVDYNAEDKKTAEASSGKEAADA